MFVYFCIIREKKEPAKPTENVSMIVKEPFQQL